MKMRRIRYNFYAKISKSRGLNFALRRIQYNFYAKISKFRGLNFANVGLA